MGPLDWLAGRPSARDLAIAELHADVRALRAPVQDTNHRTTRMEIHMSADRDFLLELAQDLSDLTAPVDAVLASEAALRARVAELEGEAAADEAGDLAAAQPVRDQLNLIAGKFAAKPDLPDVTTPEEPAPVEEPVVDEPAPVDPEAPAEPETPADEQA